MLTSYRTSLLPSVNFTVISSSLRPLFFVYHSCVYLIDDKLILKMASLTCRHWLLDPNGCSNSRCPYSHTQTGIISPPSPFACLAHNNGGCAFTQDACLYAHLDAVKNPHFLYFLRVSTFSHCSLSVLKGNQRPPTIFTGRSYSRSGRKIGI